MADNLFGASDVGRKRDNNEDAFIAETLPTGWLLACVIDGVGGYEGGEVAAEIARSTIVEKLQNATGDALQILKEALFAANRNIYNEKVAGRGNSQMACVLTAALIDTANNQAFYVHVGDTRMYLLRDGSLVKVTKDQSFVGFLEDSGRLSEAEAMTHPKRNEINKALGFDNRIEVQDDYLDTGQSPFLPGDLLMLCSDGLTDLVNNKEMTAILTASSSLNEKAQALIDAANKAGGKDNITVVLVKHDKKPQKQKATKPVLIKKSQGNPDAPAEGTLPATTQTAPVQKKSGRSNSALWVFVLLTLALAGLSYWLWNEKKKTEALLPKSIAQPVLSADAKRLSDSLGLAVRTFNFTDTLAQKTIVINDTLFVRQDSLRINGNGLVLRADSAYGGPAIVLSPNCKWIALENLTLKGFGVGIQTYSKDLSFRNVIFQSGGIAVQKSLLLSTTDTLNGKLTETFIHWKDSLPK